MDGSSWGGSLCCTSKHFLTLMGTVDKWPEHLYMVNLSIPWMPQYTRTYQQGLGSVRCTNQSAVWAQFPFPFINRIRIVGMATCTSHRAPRMCQLSCQTGGGQQCAQRSWVFCWCPMEQLASIGCNDQAEHFHNQSLVAHQSQPRK